MESWKDIKGYEGYYQISDLGNVKSLERKSKGLSGSIRILKERLLRPSGGTGNYLKVVLVKNCNVKSFRCHVLVAQAFLGHLPDGTHRICVDHIDCDIHNNKVENLQLLSSRENLSKDKGSKNSSSKYLGVHWNKKSSKWMSQIFVNGKSEYLGYFTDEKEAGEAYKNRLKEITK